VPGVYVGERSSNHVRVVFRKDGSNWTAFFSECPDVHCLQTISSDYPRESVWHISFSGREVGQVTARTPASFPFYSHIGLQDIISTGPVPTIGEPSDAYGGYTGASVHRPLVAVSEPYFRDPETWRPSKLTASLEKEVRKKFRLQFPRLCRQPGEESPLEAYRYANEDVKTVETFGSALGWAVVRLHLDGAIDCDDTEAGFGIDDAWFTVDPKGSARYLASGMWFVDAGDYDNNGQSELLFSINRDNRGGYVLFYDNFKGRVVFQYGFH
jgi:hypothetical protein